MSLLTESEIRALQAQHPTDNDPIAFSLAVQQALIDKLVGDVEIPQQIVWEIPSYGTDIIFCEGYDESQMREAIAAARLQEREQCAEVCIRLDELHPPLIRAASQKCADTIRTLGEVK